MHVVVTGGAGFLGSHLTDALLARGEETTIVDNFDPYYPESAKHRNLEGCLANGVRLLRGDVRHSVGIRQTFEQLRPNVVVHLAARPGVRASVEFPELYIDVNIKGTLSVLDACRDNGVTRVIFASSSSVYGINNKLPFSEDDPILAPVSPYGASKASGELLCHAYSHLYELNITCLRFFTAYGPRQRPDMAMHKFARLLKAGEPVPVFQHARGRDYTYVSDVVSGIMAAIDRPRPYRIYNLGSSTLIGLDRVVSLLAANLGVKATIERLEAQPGDVPVTVADISRARVELGYQPKVPFEEGIKLFATWFLSQPREDSSPSQT